MAKIIDFWTAQEVRPAMAPEMKCRCTTCGTDLWHIGTNGEVSCADCDAVCPLRLQMKNDC